MRSIISIVMLTVVTTVTAQNFEGIMKWKMTMEFSDPAVRAEVERSAQKMSAPAQQEQMAELKKQMENPQMKAMMESNPQLKAQMEKMMSANLSSGGNMMPTGFTIKSKNGNTLTAMEGGMMRDMEILYLHDKNQSYRLNRNNKTYAIIKSDPSQNSKPEVSVTKTGMTTKVLNYTCTQYFVKITTPETTVNQVFWNTTEIKDLDFKSMRQQRMGNGNSMYYEGMEGVPLKIELTTPQGKMTMEATEIIRSGLNDSDFKIPLDYKEVVDTTPGRP